MHLHNLQQSLDMILDVVFLPLIKILKITFREQLYR